MAGNAATGSASMMGPFDNFLPLSFDLPWACLLLPLPWLVQLLLKPLQTSVAAQVPFLHEITALQGDSHSTSHGNSRWRSSIAWLAWLLLVLACAAPKWFDDPVALPVSGRDLMLAVDISGSMQVEDFVLSGTAIDRLQATKQVVEAFLKKRQGDRVGLILFADQAYVQVPLTFDLATVQTLLNEAVVGLAGKATAIGDAIGLSVKRLQQSNADGHISTTDQVLILLTDGVNTAGELSPDKAAELAAKLGLKIYTIGIGADKMTIRSFFGARTVNPSAELDEATLKAIAELTEGKYFRAHDASELAKIYANIDQLEPVQRDAQTFRPEHALFMWPLSLALALIALLMLSRIRWQKGLVAP